LKQSDSNEVVLSGAIKQIILSVAMLSIVMLSAIMLSVVMLSIVVLSVVMLIVVILNVVAQSNCLGSVLKSHYKETFPTDNTIKLF
jgi:hypothetical protein